MPFVTGYDQPALEAFVFTPRRSPPFEEDRETDARHTA
jgi:hypothetical protein